MPNLEQYEVLIVGGGKAGKTLAADLARAGRRVALVERGLVGGSCVNVGCIPTKAIVKSAKVAELTARAGEFGIDTAGWRANMPAIIARKADVVASVVNLNWDTLHGSLGDNYIFGQATLIAPRTVEVRSHAGASVRHIAGEKVFLNLGAAPSMPKLPGLADAQPLTSTSALELARLPEHLVILGGGYVGVEFGQAFGRFGSRVTIVQRGARLLPAEDSDVSEAVEAILREDGIELLLNADVSAVAGLSGDRVRLTLRQPGGEKSLEGSDLLVAVGRSPLTEGVGLETAGVELNPAGFIRVNERLETTAPFTWALGDCAGSPQQTHVALDDYRIVKANVFGAGGRSTADRLIPHTVYIDPELGRVGLTEREARASGIGFKVARVPASVIPRARTASETRGFLKAVVETQTDQILGFAMLAADAGEVTAAVQMAMLGRLPFTRVRDAVIAHPTMAEGLNYLFNSKMT